MSTIQFNRDSMARWYAKEHLKTDSGVASIYYLPSDADDREIRFVEINSLISDRTNDALEPIDFGIDMGTDNAHKLFVLDVTPDQWERVQAGELPLPHGWSLVAAIEYKQ